MKIRLSFLIVIMALSALALAQAPAESAAQSTDPLPAGSLIPADLSKSLDAKKAKSGDKFEARTSVDLILNGQIILPRNTKLIGHVTDAKPHSKESPDSKLSIAFDHMVLKDGREFPIQLVIQAIARPLPIQHDETVIPGTGAGPASSQSGQVGATESPASVQNTPSQYPTMSAPQVPKPSGPSVPTLTPESHGVVGMKDVELSGSKEANVISSGSQNIHLDSGTQLMLRKE